MLLLRKNLTARLSPWGTAFTSSSSSSSSVYRLLSTPPTHEEPPSRTTTTTTTTTTSSEFAVKYLINSCGLPSDKAVRAARYIPHLKSPHKPDAVLQFLRQAGITEPHIRAAALRHARFLVCNLKCLKTRMAQLQEIGFSPSHLSLLLSINPAVFHLTNLQERVKFWIPTFFCSVEKLLAVLKQNFLLLSVNPRTSSANITFLQEQCGLSIQRIAKLIMFAPRLITFSHDCLKINVKRAEDLGVSRESGMFIHALKVVNSLKPSTIEARLHHLRELGLSQEEVRLLIRAAPSVLFISEEMISRKMEFLIKIARCDKSHLVQNPTLLTYSLEKRLFPRNLVRELLDSKGLLVAKKTFASLVTPSEERFVEKFVLPYENIIPGLHQAYKEVCAGNTRRIEWFKSISS